MANVSTFLKCLQDYAGLGEGEAVWLVRMCQDAGILPKGSRGRGPMPEITAKHCADTLLTMAGTRLPGQRNVGDARSALNRLRHLTTKKPLPGLSDGVLGRNLVEVAKNSDESCRIRISYLA